MDNKKTGPVDIIAPSAENNAEPETAESSKEAKSPEIPSVKLIIEHGESKTCEMKDVRFHTPTLLDQVKGLLDSDSVKITVTDEEQEGKTRTLLEGTKADAIAALEKSIVPADKLAFELRKFAQFLLDHSTLKAIGVHAICTASEGQDAGFGFVATSHDCTKAHAVALVNCGDANIDEFIAKAQIEVPGRNGTPSKGTVLTPTPEQVDTLG